jgi:hypothetical protein
LDFYLTNAPLHLVAQENSKDEIADWRIRCTINGSSFALDRWAPIYLTGFKQGKNWVQLEFLDEQGNPVKNTFNNTVRVITYEPKGRDTLSKLVRGELSADEARGIVDRNAAKVPATPTPMPSAEATPVPVPSEEKAAEPEVEKGPDQTEPKEFKQPERQKSPNFFNRFRRPNVTPPSLPPTLPEIIDAPSSELVAPEAVPQPDSAEPESENLTTESDAPKPQLDIKEILLP